MRIGLLMLLMVSGCVTRAERMQRAVERGVEYLVKSQNADGSWGKGMMTEGVCWLYSSVPGTFEACRVGTTALGVMALREAGEREAHDKAVEYLLTHGEEARRDKGDLIYNIWAHFYVVQALSVEMRTNSDARLAKAVAWHLDRLVRYEDMRGGWNYYDFDYRAQRPAGTPVSFGTAAGLVALWEARQSGIDVPQTLINRAVKALERMRLPNGSYLYGEYLEYYPRALSNLPRGAVGRVQPCNYALWLWGSKRVGLAESLGGLEMFDKEHPFLEMGRKRPFPHSSWYQTAPYYYYFDHYYASLLIERLDEAGKRKYGRMIADWIVPLQEADGSWWDFAMWDYHKPYGTAFAVMTLRRCQ